MQKFTRFLQYYEFTNKLYYGNYEEIFNNIEVNISSELSQLTDENIRGNRNNSINNAENLVFKMKSFI